MLNIEGGSRGVGKEFVAVHLCCVVWIQSASNPKQLRTGEYLPCNLTLIDSQLQIGG